MITWHFKSFEELTTHEVYEIIRLRLQVFVVEQNAPYQDCDLKDYKSYHIFGVLNHEIVAYARLIPAAISYPEPCLGRVVTAPQVRGQGHGRALVFLALEAMKTLFETETCRISAQLYLQPFYESYGFKRVSDIYFEDGLPHVEMVKI